MRHSLALALLASLALAGCHASRPKPQVAPESTMGSHLDLTESKADKATEAARIHTELGQQYMQNGNDKDALEKLQKALKFSEKYAPAHTVIAVLYEKIGDPVNAEIHYRRAEELDPKAGATNNNLGVFLCKQNKTAEAQAYFDRAVADPFYATPDGALSNAGTCQLKAGQLDSAEIDFRKSLSRNPRNGEALYQMAHVLYLKNDAFRARAFLQRFEAFGQSSPDALKLGHDIETKLGNGPGAQDYAKRLRSQYPDSDSTHTLDATVSQ